MFSWSNKRKEIEPARKVHFFEDEYRHIEILPAENPEICPENAEILKVHDLKIAGNLLDETLKSVVPKYDEVIYHNGSDYEKSEFTSAFGYDENVVAFYDEEDGFVKTIWLRLDIKKENDIERACKLFAALSELGNFIIDDLGWGFVEKINNDEEIKQYLQNRFNVFSARVL